MIVESPWSEITGVEPVLRSRKVPVPWVVFASPGRRQPCPNSAADWSATAAAIGTSAPSTSALVVAMTPESSTTCGSTARGMFRASSHSPYHSPVWMS